MIIRVQAYDGKEFKGLDTDKLIKECNAYEANLRLQAEKIEAEKKAKEEADKKLSEFRNVKLKEIAEVFTKAKTLVAEYENTTGNKLTYGYDINGNIAFKEVRNSIDFAWDNLLDDLQKIFGNK